MDEPVDLNELRRLHREALATIYALIQLNLEGVVTPTQILHLGMYQGMIAKLLSENSHALTCLSCGNAVPLTDAEAKIWDDGMKEIEGTAYCKVCGGILKLSATSP